ncbi:glycosyltransferase [Pseudodesulfovibrio sp. JC047]|uniref:glycosyltransferase family 2 protein n=1 Tax=Pseudodesulfovibrio sp. JC047 TaxID=2683199 RepID=UPI0013D8D091|nr:glycosyltransferase family A protein [Pseudodesulfovibrio sp. JC047]NDV19667.1 glycosyltransferase [Pseudodesulfovibrio sp. JC047]
MPQVSIIIPNYNYGHFSDRLFGSIAAQTLPLETVEILFVDDGSTDESVANATQWATRLPCARFEILQLDHTGSPGPVRNAGLATATGHYLLCMDADDSLLPDFLARCVNTLDTTPDTDIVYTDYLEKGLHSARKVALPKFNQGLLRTQNILPNTAMYRRWIWDAGIRYRTTTEYEDWDYWIQCVMKKARFLHLPTPLFIYEMHSANFSHTARDHDGHAKATIVKNNPPFFHPTVQEWAEGLLRGRLHAHPFQRGYIPTPIDIRTLLKTVERRGITAPDAP